MARDLLQDFETPAEYRDVVVVGNGPSALTLSFMLAGNHPYYCPPLDSPLPSSVPPYLHYKLTDNVHTSLLDQNLDYLSEGIFGRSSNPVSNLFDTLNHPGADLGETHPSLLDWRPYRGHRPVIDHVVLGRGQVGGLWQKMSSSVQTVSPLAWLQLPALPFDLFQGQDARPARVSAADAARYYAEYASRQNLSQFFRCGYLVESVRPFTPLSQSADDAERLWLVEGTCLDSASTSNTHALRSSDGTSRFRFVSRVVVLACGGAELPVRLPCSRDHHLATHSLSALDHLLGSGYLDDPAHHLLSRNSGRESCDNGSDIVKLCSSLSGRRRCSSSSSLLVPPPPAASPDARPLLVVGSGLSAADAVLTALRRGIAVVHVFRRRSLDRRISFSSLPEDAAYSEYHQLVAAMRQGPAALRRWPHYRPLPETRLVHVGADGWVTLVTRHTGLQWLRVRHVAVLIGSRPCLSFVHIGDLGRDINNNNNQSNNKANISRLALTSDRESVDGAGEGHGEGRSLGVDSSRAVDCRANPVNCDAISHQVVSRSGEPVAGLYAVGPLVGDNLVRFLQGSALAVTASVRHALLASAADASALMVAADAGAVQESDSGCCSEDGSAEMLGDFFTLDFHSENSQVM